jgi:hypothetical protein
MRRNRNVGPTTRPVNRGAGQMPRRRDGADPRGDEQRPGGAIVARSGEPATGTAPNARNRAGRGS